ncbi:MAG: hypothetical protein U0168_00825 [Nannocystaceae bacterium]
MTDSPDTVPVDLSLAERESAGVGSGDTQVALEVDLAAERPIHTLHGLRPDRTSRRIAIAMAVLAVTLVGVFAFAGEDDDEPAASAGAHDGAVARLEPQLHRPMDAALAQIEAMRAEPITLAANAANHDREGRRRAARSPATSTAGRTARPPRSSGTGDRDAALARPVPPPPPEQPPAAAPEPRERPGLPGVVDLEDAADPSDEAESAAPS